MLNTNGPATQSNREHKFFEKYLDNNLPIPLLDPVITIFILIYPLIFL